jgi:hypothetical protein
MDSRRTVVARIADILVELLEEKGNALKLAWKADLIIDCVRGIWTQCKDLKGLHERFWEEPNIYFAQYDVLVCTTVIGAGFSIDSQFVCFHAFFFVGGLTFEEELLPRLLPRRSAHLRGTRRATAHRPFETCGGSST